MLDHQIAATRLARARFSDAPFLEFPYDPPARDVDRGDFTTAEPLRVGADGHIVPADAPGMGYALASRAPAWNETRASRSEGRWTANGCR